MRFVLMGTFFGFVLSRAGATDFDAIAGMFTLTDLQLFGVIGVAVAVSAPLFAFFKKRGIACESGCQRTLKPKPRKAGNVLGGLLFGAGWAITGTCPGTVLAQLGEGKVVALFTLAGVLVGTALYRRFGASVEARLADASSSLPSRRDARLGAPVAGQRG